MFTKCCAQTYQDIQIILVDDGSSDNSGELFVKVARKRIIGSEVIHKKNGGLSNARNVGIEQAKENI